ncbi:MAG TPA: hypothetical protein VF113_06025 [Stellaceae bacterium]
MALSFLIGRSNPQILADFDADEDVLYVSLGKPTASYADEGDGGILYRFSYDGGKPSGVTIIGFLGNWRPRRAEAYDRIAQFLNVSPKAVKTSIERHV